MKNKQYNGIIEDPRSPEAKAKDFQHSQLASSVVLNWVEKTQSEWKSYKMRDQNGSSSCCGQSAAKAIEVFTGEVESAQPIYRSRSNFPAGGMYLQDVGEICRKIGTTTEALCPSQLQGESVMNRPITVDTPIKASGYVFVDHKNIDSIAEAIEMYGHCIMIFHGNRLEWNDIPKYNPNLSIDIGHCICAVDYFLYKGKKVILIEDSWGKATTMGNGGQRLITPEYLKARFSGAIYLTPMVPPVITFKRTLRFGMSGEDVSQLQRILKSKGFFPQGQVTTLFFGKITRSGVIAFQKASGLVADGIVGPKTVAKLVV